MGIDQTTFPSLLCIVTPWQQNGNTLDWLAHSKALGLSILIDELVCPELWHHGLLLTTSFTDQTDLVGPLLPSPERHHPWRPSWGESFNVTRFEYVVTFCQSAG